MSDDGTGPGSRAVGRGPHLALLAVLAGLGMVGPFSIDTMFPAFADLQRDFSITPAATQQLLSVYLVSFAAMSLWHGPISDAVGRRPVVMVGSAAYAIASIGCALAPTFGALLVLRAIQGMSAGAGQIVSRAMVRDLYDGPQAQRVMSHIAMIFGLAPAVAPVVGGLLLKVTDWRGIFVFLAGFGALLLVATLLVLPKTHPARRRTPLRVRPLVGGLWAVTRERDGRRLAVALTLTFAAMFGYISAAPLFVTQVLRLGAQDFWVLFVPLIGGMIVGSWVSGRLAHRVRGGTLSGAGFAISIAGGTVNVLLALLPGGPRLPWSVAVLPVITFGVALCAPILTLAMLDRFPERRGAAASVQTFSSLLFNAALAGVVAPLIGASALGLALAGLAASLLGALVWWRYRRGNGPVPAPPDDPAALEPMDEL